MNKELCSIVFGIVMLCLMAYVPMGTAQIESSLPITINTDKTVYNYGDNIIIQGMIQNIRVGQVVILVVTDLQRNIITVDQLGISENRSYSTEIQALGPLWEKDNVYVIKVQYGSEIKNKIDIIVGNVTENANIQCGNNEFLASGHCIEFNMNNGVITGAVIDGEKNILTVMIESTNNGTIIINPHTDVLRDIQGVMINGEKSAYSMLNETRIQVDFSKGTQKIEIYATSIVPEFGAIIPMILVIGIMVCIAISARSKIVTRIID